MHLSLRSLLLPLFGLCSICLHAQVSVRTERPAKLFALPTERSLILTEVAGRTNFRALEQSADRQWVFISDGLRYGWIRKIFVSSVDETAAAISDLAATAPPVTKESVVEDTAPDKDLPEEEDLEDEDKVAAEGDGIEEEEDDTDDVYLVKIPGSFYEEPKKNTQRFGKLEPNDRVEILDTSKDSKWSKVRLVETGEEGWVPRLRIGRKVPRSELNEMERPSDKLWHLGVYGNYSPAPWNYGFMGTIRRGFRSLSIGQTPIEIGIGAGLNVGTLETYLDTDIAATYLDMRLFARYEPLLSARISLPLELGVLIKYGIIETELSEADFEASNTRIMPAEFGGYVGVGLSYFIFNSLKLEVQPQIQLTSSVDITLNAGIVLSF